MRIYWVGEFENGDIGMMARPRGNDWLEDEIKKLKLSDVKCVISLLEQSEISELEIEKEAFYCHQNQIDFINFPIKDRGLPEKNAFISLRQLKFNKYTFWLNIFVLYKAKNGSIAKLR